MAGGTRRSHAITQGMARGRDVTSWADVSVTVEFVVAHTVAMETGGLILYVGVKE